MPLEETVAFFKDREQTNTVLLDWALQSGRGKRLAKSSSTSELHMAPIRRLQAPNT
jgi:hypothetical protein